LNLRSDQVINEWAGDTEVSGGQSSFEKKGRRNPAPWGSSKNGEAGLPAGRKNNCQKGGRKYRKA